MVENYGRDAKLSNTIKLIYIKIVCVMIMSTIMGCLYGLLFSVMDIEV